MNNKIYLDENGIIVGEYVGDQTPESILNADRQFKIFRAEKEANNQSVKFLLDFTLVGKIPFDARKAGFMAISQLDLRKTAFIGGDIFTRTIIKFGVSAMGKNSPTRYFASKAEAIRWLQTD
jgi:hypothetical protein